MVEYRHRRKVDRMLLFNLHLQISISLAPYDPPPTGTSTVNILSETWHHFIIQANIFQKTCPLEQIDNFIFNNPPAPPADGGPISQTGPFSPDAIRIELAGIGSSVFYGGAAARVFVDNIILEDITPPFTPCGGICFA